MHSDLRLIGAYLNYGDQQSNETNFEPDIKYLRQLLLSGGVLTPDEDFPADSVSHWRMAGYASVLAQTALLLQVKAGHRVQLYQVIHEPGRGRYKVLVEHEHCDVGLNAMKLAIELLTGKRAQLAPVFSQFCEFARERLLPIETEAIIAAARRHRVPCFQLERFPLKRKPGGPQRIRSNGLLRLGQGRRGRLLDGTFLPDEASDYVKTWLRNAQDRRYLLNSLGVEPLTTPPEGSRNFLIVAIGERVFAAERLGDGQFTPLTDIDKSLSELALRIHQEAGNQPVSLTLAGVGLDQPLDSGLIGVLDFQMAPDLGTIFSSDSGIRTNALDVASDHLVKGLFPDPTNARIPTLAVTGTNGKTTTSRMLGHILKFAGMKPGLVCTNGIFVNGQMVSDKDAGSIDGHAWLLVRDDIDSAVLETHHLGIQTKGFAFHDCDVAVCLNVTEDHLDHGGLESLEELIDIKFALIERARKAAILFADNPGSCGMLERVTAEKLWLVSLESDIRSLRYLAGDRNAGFCVLEEIDGVEWLVLYDDGKRVPLMESRQVPATFNGTARFNVSNAMHAASAALATGLSVDTIRSALAHFRASRSQTPGRLNVYDQLPFSVIVDNAHNPDGLTQLMKFVDRQSPGGRKLISFAAPSGRWKDLYRQMARAVAGHFDVYLCNDWTAKEGAKAENHATILHDELIDCGLKQQNVMLGSRGREAWKQAFDMCAPGDLLILLLSAVEFEDAHRFIQSYSVS